MQSGPSLHIRLCSAQAVFFFAVVRTLLPVRIAELLFCVPKCAPKRQVRAHSAANGPVCVLKCARSSFRRALRNAMTAKAHQMHAISTI